MSNEFPSSRVSAADAAAIDRAKRKGTYNQIDRRPQYASPEHSRPEALLEAVNVQGNHIRGVQKSLGETQRDLYNLKLRNSLIVAVATGIVMKAPDIVRFLASLFQ